jgi:ParB/RepB/Spo0J family partition protein
MAIEIRNVPLELIELNPFQTRRNNDIEYIRALAADIKANDLLEIPAAREIEDGHYQLAFGHNRMLAFRQLSILDPKYSKIPLRIVEYTDEQMALTAWSENEQRKNLNPVERARAVNNLILKFGWNQSEVGEKLNLDRSTISNLLRILRMPDEVQHNLEDGTLTQRQVMALAPYYDLTDLEKSVLADNVEFHEFLALARNGSFDSDTIRAKMNAYLAVFQISGDESNQISIPLQPVVDIQPSLEEKTVWMPENPFAPESEPAKEEKDSFSEYEEGRKTSDPTPAPAETQPSKPAPAAEQPASEEPPPSNSTIFTITWNEDNTVFLGLRKGSGVPVMRFLQELDLELIPGIIREMAPELSK